MRLLDASRFEVVEDHGDEIGCVVVTRIGSGHAVDEFVVFINTEYAVRGEAGGKGVGDSEVHLSSNPNIILIHWLGLIS